MNRKPYSPPPAKLTVDGVIREIASRAKSPRARFLVMTGMNLVIFLLSAGMVFMFKGRGLVDGYVQYRMDTAIVHYEMSPFVRTLQLHHGAIGLAMIVIGFLIAAAMSFDFQKLRR